MVWRAILSHVGLTSMLDSLKIPCTSAYLIEFGDASCTCHLQVTLNLLTYLLIAVNNRHTWNGVDSNRDKGRRKKHSLNQWTLFDTSINVAVVYLPSTKQGDS